MRIRFGELRRIIREVAYAGIFKNGDDVLYGKYKNKKGKIKDVYKDDKDHPTIDIEPSPKGRKKDVTMGLYKVWKGEPKKDEELDEVDTDPSNNPGRPDDAFEYLGMHPSPTAAMSPPSAAGSGEEGGGEASSEPVGGEQPGKKPADKPAEDT